MKKLLFVALIGSLAIGGACSSDRPEAIATTEQHADGKKTYDDIKDEDFEAVAKKHKLPIQKDANGNKYVDYEVKTKAGKVKLRFTQMPGNKLEVKIREKPFIVPESEIFKEIDKQIEEAKKEKQGKCAEFGDSCDSCAELGDSCNPDDPGDGSDEDDFIDFIPPDSVWDNVPADMPCEGDDCGGDPEIGSTTEPTTAPTPEPVRAGIAP